MEQSRDVPVFQAPDPRSGAEYEQQPRYPNQRLRLAKRDCTMILTDAQKSDRTGSADHAILLVDDEALIRRLVEAELVALGYVTITAANSAEALDALEVHPNIAVMVTDIAMPGLDGRALAAKAQARFPHLQVILATGLDPNPEAHSTFPLLRKPYSTNTLAQAISVAISNI
jgi:CheY-like chemotaxis protein